MRLGYGMKQQVRNGPALPLISCSILSSSDLRLDCAECSDVGAPGPPHASGVARVSGLRTAHAARVERSIRRSRAQAIAIVQEKLLRLNTATLSGLSSGQVVNLVSNDVRRFDDFGPFWVFLWAGPTEAALVLLLVALAIGAAPAAAGVGTLLLVIPLQARLASTIGRLRLAAAARTDERVRITGAPSFSFSVAERHSDAFCVVVGLHGEGRSRVGLESET